MVKEIKTGGFISKDFVMPKLERPSWYLIEDELVHCTSQEIPLMTKIIKNRKEKAEKHKFSENRTSKLLILRS